MPQPTKIWKQISAVSEYENRLLFTCITATEKVKNLCPQQPIGVKYFYHFINMVY